MVHLSVELIIKATSGYNKKRNNESIPSFLRRITHLYLENKGIDDVGDELGQCRHLTVLYLYNNKLCVIPALPDNQHLTHLYLQNNDISRMTNLDYLPNLQKLYLGSNCLCLIEGLTRCTMLTELHVESQRLPPGESLLFDPRSVNATAQSLQVLNISANNIGSVAFVGQFDHLMQLICINNTLADWEQLLELIAVLKELWRLELCGNPIADSRKYREKIIVAAGSSLHVLDGKEVTQKSREFLINMKTSQKQSLPNDTLNGRPKPAEIGDFLNNLTGESQLDRLQRLGQFVIQPTERPEAVVPVQRDKQILWPASSTMPVAHKGLINILPIRTRKNFAV